MNKLLKQAFTLIELLVVIAIIGILSGLIIISMGSMTNKATIAKSQVFSNSLRNSLMTNIIGEWKFDELITATNGTTIHDTWGSGNNGTLTTGDALEKLKTGNDCVFNKCISFDGTDDGINITAGSGLDFGTGPFTIILWAKSNLFKNQAAIILKKSSYIFNSTAGWGIQYASSPQKLYVGVANGTSGIQYNTTMDAFDWTLLGITRRNDNNVYFIKNGSLISMGTLAGNIDNISNISLGHYNSLYFNGLIDDVYIYNAEIPISQIQEQYYVGLNKMLANGNIGIEEYNQRIKEISYK